MRIRVGIDGMGRIGRDVLAGGYLTVDDQHSIRVLQEPDPARLDRTAHGVDVVVEATGARSAAVDIIPASTGAARAIGEVLPEPADRLDGVAVRVPVVDGSLVDLTVPLSGPATVAQVNRAFETAADGPLTGILRYTTDPIVSHDVIGESASCLFDSELTRVVGNQVFAWYDNEWGDAQRTLDLVACTLPGR